METFQELGIIVNGLSFKVLYICSVKQLRLVIIVFSSVLLFVGAAGVNVFKHICPKDGTQVAIIVNTNDHCHEDKPVCCSNHKEDKGCCDDEYEYFHVKLDYSQEYQPFVFISAAEIPTFEWYYVVADHNEKEVNQYTNSDPPFRELSERLSILQTYLI